MFIRRLKHHKGYTYIQVVDKSWGKYKVLKSFGSFKTVEQENELIKLAENWMNKHKGKQELDFNNSTQAIEGILNNITSHKLIGMDLVLGKIFDEIGFSQIEDKLFKDLIPIGLSKKQAENGPISFSLWRKEIHRRCHLWLYGQASQYAKGIG
jgi:hypothetical protein